MKYINEYLAIENNAIIYEVDYDEDTQETCYWAFFTQETDKAIQVITEAIDDWNDEENHPELEQECLGETIESYLHDNGIAYTVDYEYYL